MEGAMNVNKITLLRFFQHSLVGLCRSCHLQLLCLYVYAISLQLFETFFKDQKVAADRICEGRCFFLILGVQYGDICDIVTDVELSAKP